MTHKIITLVNGSIKIRLSKPSKDEVEIRTHINDGIASFVYIPNHMIVDVLKTAEFLLK